MLLRFINRMCHKRELQVWNRPGCSLTWTGWGCPTSNDQSSRVYVIHFAVSADDSASLVFFAQQICLGQREMASAVTTGWHFCEIKGDQAASKGLTLPPLTFSKVQIKALLQKIYSNSKVPQCVCQVSTTHLILKHTLKHAHTLKHGPRMTSRWRPSANISPERNSRGSFPSGTSAPESFITHPATVDK